MRENVSRRDVDASNHENPIWAQTPQKQCLQLLKEEQTNVPILFTDVNAFLPYTLMMAIDLKDIPEAVRKSVQGRHDVSEILKESSKAQWQAVPESILSLVAKREDLKAVLTESTVANWQAIPQKVLQDTASNINLDTLLADANGEKWQEIPLSYWTTLAKNPELYDILEKSTSDLWRRFQEQTPAGFEQDLLSNHELVEILKSPHILKQFSVMTEKLPESACHKISQHGALVQFANFPTVIEDYQCISKELNADENKALAENDYCFEIVNYWDDDVWSMVPKRIRPILLGSGSGAWMHASIPAETWTLLAQWLEKEEVGTDKVDFAYGDMLDLIGVLRRLTDDEERKQILLDYSEKLRQLTKQHPNIDNIPQSVIDATAGLLLISPGVSPLIVERQMTRLEKAWREFTDDSSADPTVGYEFELEKLAPNKVYLDYELGVLIGAFGAGADKDFEISSNVFLDGRLAALSVNSLFKSGLITEEMLKPGEVTMHLNLGIPKELRGHVSSAEAEKLQLALLAGHSSPERIESKEWEESVRIHLNTEGSTDDDRIELRVFDLTDQYVYRLLEIAPHRAKSMYAAIAEENEIKYLDKSEQEKLAEEWRQIVERLDESEMNLESARNIGSFKKMRPKLK